MSREILITLDCRKMPAWSFISWRLDLSATCGKYLRFILSAISISRCAWATCWSGQHLDSLRGCFHLLRRLIASHCSAWCTSHTSVSLSWALTAYVKCAQYWCYALVWFSPKQKHRPGWCSVPVADKWNKGIVYTHAMSGIRLHTGMQWEIYRQ